MIPPYLIPEGGRPGRPTPAVSNTCSGNVGTPSNLILHHISKIHRNFILAGRSAPLANGALCLSTLKHNCKSGTACIPIDITTLCYSVFMLVLLYLLSMTEWKISLYFSLGGRIQISSHTYSILETYDDFITEFTASGEKKVSFIALIIASNVWGGAKGYDQKP